MNKDKRNNIKLLGTLNNADESGIIANANQIYDANENKSTQDVSKEHTERIKTLETKENSMQTTLENITKTGLNLQRKKEKNILIIILPSDANRKKVFLSKRMV